MSGESNARKDGLWPNETQRFIYTVSDQTNTQAQSNKHYPMETTRKATVSIHGGQNPRKTRRLRTAVTTVFSAWIHGGAQQFFSRIHKSIHHWKALLTQITNIILSNPNSSYILWIEAKHFHEPNFNSTYLPHFSSISRSKHISMIT